MSSKGVLRIKVIGQDAGLGQTFKSTGDKAVAWGKRVAGALVAVAAFDKIKDVISGDVRAFGNFDDAMTQSLAIMGNVSDQMRARMEAAAQDVSRSTTFSSTEAAKAYYYLASAGLSAQQSLKAMPLVAKFAQAGMFDLSAATSYLADAQSALGLRSKDAGKNLESMTRVADVLTEANIMANASVEQFSIALTTKAGAAMKSVGMDIEEGVAVLAAFADQGVKAEEGGTQFSIVLRDLQTKAIQNKKAFKEYGVEVFDSAGELNNMADIVGDLEQALGGMSDEQRKATLLEMGFTDKSIAAMLALIGTSDAISEYEEKLRVAGGTTETVAKKQLESFNSQMKLARNRIEEASITAGEQFAPAIRDAADWVGDLADNFASVAKQQGVIEGMTSTISKAMDDASNWLAQGGGEKIGKAVGQIVASGIELAVKALPSLVVNVVPAISKGVIVGGAEAANSLIRNVQDWLSGEFGADRTIVLEMQLAMSASGRNWTDEVTTEIARGTGYISDQAALAIRAGLAAGQDIATKDFGNWISNTFGLFGLNTLTKAADEMGYAYAVTLAEGVGKGEISVAAAMDKLNADLDAKDATEKATAQYQEMAEAQKAILEDHAEQLKPIIDDLTGVYQQVISPATAFAAATQVAVDALEHQADVLDKKGENKAAAALREQAGNFDAAKTSMQEYAKELEKQLASWDKYQSNVLALAKEFGPQFGAEIITEAAKQGAPFMQALMGADDATQARILGNLEKGMANNVDALAEKILPLCEATGTAMADSISAGFAKATPENPWAQYASDFAKDTGYTGPSKTIGGEIGVQMGAGAKEAWDASDVPGYATNMVLNAPWNPTGKVAGSATAGGFISQWVTSAPEQLIMNRWNSSPWAAIGAKAGAWAGASMADNIQTQLNSKAYKINVTASMNWALSPYEGSPGGGGGTASRASVVAYAASGLGTPYRWGGTSRSGWDCSGYVGNALSHAGIKHPRTAAALQAYFPRIPVSQARPGDLLFKGRPAYHTGMKALGSQVYEAKGRKWGTVATPYPDGWTSAARIPAYKYGGVQEEDGLAYVHKKERVLTTRQTDAFDRLVAAIEKWEGREAPGAAPAPGPGGGLHIHVGRLDDSGVAQMYADRFMRGI